MATNQKFQDGRYIHVAATDPTTPVSGDPVVVGQIAGVAVTDEDGNSASTIDTRGVYELTVAGVDNSGSGGADANKAVAIGDKIYYGTGDTPKLSKRDDGVFFGYALGTVSSGNTTTKINVKVGA